MSFFKGDLHEYMDMVPFSSHENDRPAKGTLMRFNQIYNSITSEKIPYLLKGQFLPHATVYLRIDVVPFQNAATIDESYVKS